MRIVRFKSQFTAKHEWRWVVTFELAPISQTYTYRGKRHVEACRALIQANLIVLYTALENIQESIILSAPQAETACAFAPDASPVYVRPHVFAL